MKILRKLVHNWNSFRITHYFDTEKSIVWLFNLFCSAMIGSLFLDSGLPQILGFLLFGGLSFLFLHILHFIITLILKLFLRNGVKTAVYIIIILLTILHPMSVGSNTIGTPAIVLSGFFLTALEVLFVRTLWSFFKHKRHSIPILLSLFFTVSMNIFIGFFLFGEGLEGNYITSYFAYNDHIPVKEDISFYKNNVENGSLPVISLEYGLSDGVNLSSKTTNLSSYIPNYKGFSSKIRNLYWGYGIDQVPLAGKIWYPKDGANYPVLFIIHGNHIMTTKSYLGYDYLGEFLASHGYVVVSVDESFCNAYIDSGLSNENDARAILLLENIKQVETYNKDKNCPLYQKIDFEQIALAGHSRGGEGVAAAALFNNYACSPDNGNIKFNYHYNINSIIAISPTCGQYKPAKHDILLEDLNYLLIHGSNDQDVSTFMGVKQYANIRFSGNKSCFKTYAYLAGANHGQFNTLWGRHDLSFPFFPYLNTKNLIDATEQRTALKAYIKVFLDSTVKQDSTYKSLFTTANSFQKELPKTIYMKGYQDSSFESLCDYEEDSDIKHGSSKDILLDAAHMRAWREEKNYDSSGYSNFGLLLKWNQTTNANYSITMSSYNGEHKYLQFDIMDINKDVGSEDIINLLNATIVLEDTKGSQTSLSLRDFCTIYPPLPVKLYKLQFLTNTADYKYCFQTVQLLMEEFETKNPLFDSSSIVKIIFKFDTMENGKIMIDNIGFGNTI